MKNEMQKWYESLTEKEVSKLKNNLESRMMFKDPSEKENIWNEILEEKYNNYMRDLERSRENQLIELEEQMKHEQQRQSDLNKGICTLELYTSNRKKAWVAEITGTDRQYGFNRKFINYFEDKGNIKIYRLAEGKYYNYLSDGTQYYAQVVNAELKEMSKSDMLDAIN